MKMSHDELQAVLWEELMQREGAMHVFEIERTREQRGRSFSEDAMDGLVLSVNAWIGTRIMRRWESTNEPPSYLRVTVTVDVG